MSETTSEMNGGDPVDAPSAPEPQRDWRYWARRLLVCNPFFLCSAGLLLFGVNRLSVDPGFLGDETHNLLFNFFALQGYELMVVLTAVVLSRRRIWYDSALLVVLENGLVLVPFMLISQAALIGGPLATSLTLAGGALAASRFAGVRRWYPQFNLPGRVQWLGGLLLVANVALPRIFRPLMENDVADWHVPDRIGWYVILPVLAAGANLLPRPARYGGLSPERHWLPLFCYGLWVVGSAVHLWCVQHICDLPFTVSQLAPLTFAGVWTLWRRLADCVMRVTPAWEAGILALTALAPLLAVGDPLMLVVVGGLSTCCYTVLAVTGNETTRRLARCLAVVSIALVLMGCPLGWGGMLFSGFTRAHAWLGGLTFYVVWCALRSPRPEAGLAGAGLVAIDIARLLGSSGVHWSMQIGFVLVLAHSLRWRDDRHGGVRFLRNCLAAAWVLASALNTRHSTLAELSPVPAGAIVLLIAWSLAWWWRGERPTVILPGAALLALCAGPGQWLARVGATGLLALLGSGILFGAGIVAAWTRHRWDHVREEPTLDAVQDSAPDH
ncbi:MAG TPA: hypothetical protein VNU68_16050 [Verrucomicrobiae bacterium]|nr:hypothetical protein [Verrucomicrobiae bacterium]